MAKPIPRTWSDLDFSKPDDDEFSGTHLSLPGGRVLIRSYDTTKASFSAITGDPDGWYEFDTSPIPVLDPNMTPLVGDTIFYLGEVRGEDRVNLWAPMRVVWVGDVLNRFVPVKTLVDTSLEGVISGEACVPLDMLAAEEQNTVKELAESLEPADEAQSRVLLQVFDCDWVLDRPQPHS